MPGSPRRGDVALGKERLVENVYTRLLQPGLGAQVGTSGDGFE